MRGRSHRELGPQNTTSHDGRLPADGHDVGGVDGPDDGRPQYGHAVVDHGADAGAHDEGQVANVLKDTRRYDAVTLDHVLLVQAEHDQSAQSDHNGTNSGALPRVRLAAPGQADQEKHEPAKKRIILP